MQQKGEEQVQKLEAILQEQASKTEGHIIQLAGEVASMKESVEELLNVGVQVNFTYMFIISIHIKSYYEWIQSWNMNNSLLHLLALHLFFM